MRFRLMVWVAQWLGSWVSSIIGATEASLRVTELPVGFSGGWEKASAGCIGSSDVHPSCGEGTGRNSICQDESLLSIIDKKEKTNARQ